MGDDRLLLPLGTPSASEAPTRDQTTKNLELEVVEDETAESHFRMTPWAWFGLDR